MNSEGPCLQTNELRLFCENGDVFVNCEIEITKVKPVECDECHTFLKLEVPDDDFSANGVGDNSNSSDYINISITNNNDDCNKEVESSESQDIESIDYPDTALGNVLKEFASEYENEMQLIKSAEKIVDGDSKNAVINCKEKVLESWIKDVMIQNKHLVNDLEHIDDVGAMVFRSSTRYESHEEDLKELQEKLEVANDQIISLKTNNNSLVDLVCRIRDEGTWDLDGLEFEWSTYEKLFGLYPNLPGSKVHPSHKEIHATLLMEGRMKELGQKIDSLKQDKKNLESVLSEKERTITILETKTNALTYDMNQYEDCQSALDETHNKLIEMTNKSSSAVKEELSLELKKRDKDIERLLLDLKEIKQNLTRANRANEGKIDQNEVSEEMSKMLESIQKEVKATQSVLKMVQETQHNLCTSHQIYEYQSKYENALTLIATKADVIENLQEKMVDTLNKKVKNYKNECISPKVAHQIESDGIVNTTQKNVISKNTTSTVPRNSCKDKSLITATEEQKIISSEGHMNTTSSKIPQAIEAPQKSKETNVPKTNKPCVNTIKKIVETKEQINVPNKSKTLSSRGPKNAISTESKLQKIVDYKNKSEESIKSKLNGDGPGVEMVRSKGKQMEDIVDSKKYLRLRPTTRSLHLPASIPDKRQVRPAPANEERKDHRVRNNETKKTHSASINKTNKIPSSSAPVNATSKIPPPTPTNTTSKIPPPTPTNTTSKIPLSLTPTKTNNIPSTAPRNTARQIPTIAPLKATSKIPPAPKSAQRKIVQNDCEQRPVGENTLKRSDTFGVFHTPTTKSRIPIYVTPKVRTPVKKDETKKKVITDTTAAQLSTLNNLLEVALKGSKQMLSENPLSSFSLTACHARGRGHRSISATKLHTKQEDSCMKSPAGILKPRMEKAKSEKALKVGVRFRSKAKLNEAKSSSSASENATYSKTRTTHRKPKLNKSKKDDMLRKLPHPSPKSSVKQWIENSSSMTCIPYVDESPKCKDRSKSKGSNSGRSALSTSSRKSLRKRSHPTSSYFTRDPTFSFDEELATKISKNQSATLDDYYFAESTPPFQYGKKSSGT